MQQFLTRQYRLIFPVLIMGIAGLAFYVGMLEGREGGQGSTVSLNCSDSVLSTLAIPTRALAQDTAPEVLGATTAQQGAFAGSKNGTKYYTPGCAGLDRIKPENRIWFQTAADAELQGYTAASC